jgi:hypothetical protein
VADLTELLRAAATEPARRPEFVSALLASEVYVLGWMDRPLVDGMAQAGSSMQVSTWQDADGPVTPFFTSEATLQQSLEATGGTDPRFLRLRTRDFFEMLRGQRLVLDPHGYGKVFLPAEVEALLEGRDADGATEVVAADEQVLVGAPAQVPPDLLRVLGSFFAARPAAERAFLGWIVRGDGHAGYLLVVVASDRDAAMAGFGAIQIGELTDGTTIDVMVPPPGAPHLLSSLEPFYVRGDA